MSNLNCGKKYHIVAEVVFGNEIYKNMTVESFLSSCSYLNSSSFFLVPFVFSPYYLSLSPQSRINWELFLDREMTFSLFQQLLSISVSKKVNMSSTKELRKEEGS